MVKKGRGQVKIQQMAFMLIAVTILFVLAGMAFLILKSGDLKNSASEAKERDARLMVLSLADSPEFSCGRSFGNEKFGCVDANKVMILSEPNHIKKYEKFWGVSKIEIIRLFPSLSGEVQCTLQNFPNCNVLQVLDQGGEGFSSENFISLCRKETLNGETYNQCDLAKLVIWSKNIK